MAQAAAIQAVATVAATAYGIHSSMEAAKAQDRAADEAERMGRENAARIEEEGREEKRRQEKAFAAKEAKSRAFAGASGTTGGSMSTVQEEMAREHGRQTAWLARSTASKAQAAREGAAYEGMTGRARADATRAAGIGKGLSGVSNIYSAGLKANWWRS